MKRSVTIGIVTILSLSLVSCATMPTVPTGNPAIKSEVEELKKRINELKQENEKLREEIAAAESLEMKDVVIETKQSSATDTDMDKDIDLLDAFVSGEIKAESMYEGEEQFSISDLTDVEDEWLRYSEKERRDFDNDGEDELYMDGPYGGMILDARDGKVVILTEGEGTSGVLSYTDYDNAIWICHADTSHGGRQMFFFDKYNDKGEITGSMSLKAEYWESPDDRYDENSIFTFNDENITMQEFEKLRHEFFPDVEGYRIEDTNTESKMQGMSVQHTDDGVYESYLAESDKALVGTNDSLGNPNHILYQYSLDGNVLYLYGSMYYRKDAFHCEDISGDVHAFILDDNARFGEAYGEGPEKSMTKDEFFLILNEMMDSGQCLAVMVENGVVTSVYITA